MKSENRMQECTGKKARSSNTKSREESLSFRYALIGVQNVETSRSGHHAESKSGQAPTTRLMVHENTLECVHVISRVRFVVPPLPVHTALPLGSNPMQSADGMVVVVVSRSTPLPIRAS